MDKEKVYINGGIIYKDEDIKTVVNNYTYDDNGDPLFRYSKKVSSEYPRGKQYLFTKQFKSYFTEDKTRKGVELTNYDLCPDVSLWIALGAPDENETQDYDLFFSVSSVEELRAVAEYYKLPYPITSEVEEIITNAPETINFWKVGDHSVVPAGIQYRNGLPSILKLYTYPTEVKDWMTWMRGYSYFNEGTLYESGHVLHQLTGGAGKEGFILRGTGNFEKAEKISSTIEGKLSTDYYFTSVNTGGDPIIMWAAEETNLITKETRTKRYESSKMMRQLIGNLSSGSNFENYDLPSDIEFLLGRSYYDNNNTETEVFFVATNTQQLKSISDHYSLKVPYDDRLKDKLDNDPVSLRVRHYDMLGLGEGRFVPVVAGGIIFEGNVAKQINLYEFTRETAQ